MMTVSKLLMPITMLVTMTFSMLLPSASYGHGGGLDSKGCHNNRKTGSYHCHRSQAKPSKPAQSNKSLNSKKTSYKNCKEARAAGAAPVKRSDPGYGKHLDRDNDGVGCE